MIGGSNVFMYCCGFGFALGWLTCDRSDFQVFAPTDVLMTVSLTDIRAVASSTRITIDDVRLEVRWELILERKQPLQTSLLAKNYLNFTAVLNVFVDVLPDSVADFE